MRLLLGMLLMTISLVAQAENDRWEIDKAGGIKTTLAKLTRGSAHNDHIEMGGRSINVIVEWAVSADGKVTTNRQLRWPMLREKKDDTHASFHVALQSGDDPGLKVDGEDYQSGRAETFRIWGMLQWTEKGSKLTVTKTLFPSVSLPAFIEQWEIENTSSKPVEVVVPTEPKETEYPAEQFLWGPCMVRTQWIGGSRTWLMPGQKMTTGVAISAREVGQPAPYPDIEGEWVARKAFVDRLDASLHLTTGDAVVDQLFAFSKLRAAENVLATRGGLMHAPGGYNRYLAALWCNDQNEYASPFFPYLGDAAGHESARNAYLWFAKYMNPEFKPIPSSIVAEGRGIWNGAGDRGDAAMTAYGASRWALATGDIDRAREVWPLIQWCLEYCERKKTADGVIASDADELEGRFSHGKTNLSTSCLTYDALLSAAYLVEAMGEDKAVAKTYRARAAELKTAINRFFGAKIDGFETYRYHEGLDSLRAWICIPLAMDIFDRAEGTVDALFSPELWTKDGLLTAVGDTTYWDRSTLYALRGVFRAGRPDLAAKHLDSYSRQRLLGDHVPYCREAYPEQGQSQLSAESALYCRVVTEGALGIRPTGFQSFAISSHLPREWKEISLRQIHAFGRTWDCTVKRAAGGKLKVEVLVAGKLVVSKTAGEGEILTVELP